MALLRIDVIEGRSDAELRALLDAAHRATVAAFEVPEHDRYQIVHEHKPSRMIIEDTGLGMARTNKVVVVHVTTRVCTRKVKETFYRLLCEKLQRYCGIAPSDVVVTMTENTEDNWSFGLGHAQFVTHEL